MRERIDKGAAWFALLAIVGSVFGMLVWGTFGRNHTKVVTQTKTRTVVVTKRVTANATWDSTAQSLANYLRPARAAQMPCAKGTPARVKCYGFLGQNNLWYVTLATASS